MCAIAQILFNRAVANLGESGHQGGLRAYFTMHNIVPHRQWSYCTI